LLINIRGELDHQMQPCSDAVVPNTRKESAKRLHEGVTPPPIDLSRASEMAVKRATLQEIGKRQLFERGGSAVRAELRSCDVVCYIGWHDEPPETQCR
jgi:hypothetical protein